MKKIVGLQLVIGVLIVLFIGLIFPAYERYLGFLDSNAVYLGILLKLLYLLLGVLIEGNHILDITKGVPYKFKLPTFVFAIILVIISSLSGFYVAWFGWGPLMKFNPFLHSEVNAILTVIAGVLLVRSFKRID